MYKVVKYGKQWLLYNTTNGTFLRKFKGNGTKKEAIKECLLRNKIALQ